jgi:hypothetical protein
MRIFSGWRAEADGFGAMVASERADEIEWFERSDRLREATLNIEKERGVRLRSKKGNGWDQLEELTRYRAIR